MCVHAQYFMKYIKKIGKILSLDGAITQKIQMCTFLGMKYDTLKQSDKKKTIK